MSNTEKPLVVDAHAHPPRKGSPGIDERPYTPPHTQQEVEDFLQQDLGEILSQMDLLGIDMKVMMAFPPDLDATFHYGATNPDTNVRTLSSHEWIARACALYPKRFVGCACLNPLDETAPNALQKLVIEDGFKMVKIHQAHHNFMVNDPRAYPFYRTCIELDVPVAFHTGFSPVRHIDRLIPTIPLLLDELAWDLPELRIVMCHTGGNWYQDGVVVAMRNKNIWVDLAGLNGIDELMVWPKVNPKELIARIVEMLGSHRVFYGTDNMDAAFNLEYMQDVALYPEDLHMVMGQSVVNFLKLE